MADMQSEYWYFDDGVDPNKILVPQLRSILLRHNVTYPASAKKPALVELFREHVLPQAAQIQRAHARTKRSTRGIVDVPSSAASTTTDDADDDTLPVAPPTVKRTSRRTTRSATEEETELPAPRGKTPSRTVPTKHAREPDADADGQPAMRRSRKSTVPVTRNPPLDADADVESPFTQDNPFQSGSSPLGLNSNARDRRRKSMGFEHKEKRKSDANRRRTIQPKAEQQDDGVKVPSRKTFDAPALRGKREEPVLPDAVDASEDFTPEEQLDLVRARAQNGEVDILPPRRRNQRSKAAGTAKAFSLTLLTTFLAAFAGVWRQEKIAVGFCGIGRDDSIALAGLDIPEFATALLPQCEPCPPHATCLSELRVTCDTDFVKKDHPLALGGLVPLPPTCEADTDKTRKVNVVANQAVQILRKRRAQYECKEPDVEGKVVQSPEVSVDDIKQNILAMKAKAMSNAEFEDLFAKAIGETAMREEIVEVADGTRRRLASTSLAELTLVCSIGRSLRTSVEQHILAIVIAFLTVVFGAYGKYSITTNRAMETRAKQLASNVFDRLANQAALASHESGARQERGLSMNQLRDDVLRNEFSSSRRIKLWQRVQKKVEHNSNIRAAVREGPSGDITRMWEWTGPVQMLEDARSSGKPDGGRYSLEWAPNSTPPQPPQQRDMKEVKQWDEGHPIY